MNPSPPDILTPPRERSRLEPHPNQSALAALRRYMHSPAPGAPPGPRSVCELCAAPLENSHRHLLELSSRRLLCACERCAVLFASQGNARHRLVPRDLHRLMDFQMSDAQWEMLNIPIRLAFFVRISTLERVVALYPGPAGATESLLTLEFWSELTRLNSALQQMQPDVEALLVNRLCNIGEYWLAPIDECYKLVGLIRTQWRGLSGGAEVWKALEDFFNDLRLRARRSEPCPCPT